MEKKKAKNNKNTSQRNAREEKMQYEQQREAQLLEDILNEFKNFDVDADLQMLEHDLDTIEPEYGFDMPDYVKALFSGNTEDFDDPLPTEDDFRIDPSFFVPLEDEVQPDEFEVNIDFEEETMSDPDNVDFFADLFANSSPSAEKVEVDEDLTTDFDVSVFEEEDVEDHSTEAEDEIAEIDLSEDFPEITFDIPIIEESAGIEIVAEDYSEEDDGEDYESESSDEEDNEPESFDKNIQIPESSDEANNKSEASVENNDDFSSTRELRTEFFTAEFDKKFREMFSNSLDNEDKKLGGRKMRNARVTHDDLVEIGTIKTDDIFDGDTESPAPRKNKKKRKGLWVTLLIIFIGVFIFSGYQFINIFMSLQRESATLGDLANLVSMVENGDEGTVKVNGVEYDTTMVDDNSEILPKFQSLYSTNNDLAGWLKIPGTVIDYPVMYKPSINEYYLHRDFFGKDSRSGTLFVDENCDIKNGDNQIIYGHNMKNDTMFGTLDKYSSKDFWEKNQYIYYDSIYEERVYQVVCVFKSRVLNKNEDGFRYYRFYGSETEEEFNEYVDGIKELELYDTGIDISYGDELITLSTCAYFTKDGRFVVVAKRIS